MKNAVKKSVAKAPGKEMQDWLAAEKEIAESID